jgi:hypothetical protein
MKRQVKGEKRGLAVGLTAPTGPVRGLFRARPWAGPCPTVVRTAPESGAHGRIADDGGPDSRLGRCLCWPADCAQAEGACCKTVGLSRPPPPSLPGLAACRCSNPAALPSVGRSATRYPSDLP